MSIKVKYFTRAKMLEASKWCFYDDEQARKDADSVINAVFDAREYTEVAFSSIENEFRIRGESALVNDLIGYLG